MAEEKECTTVPVTTTLPYSSYYGAGLRGSLLARSGYGWGGYGGLYGSAYGHGYGGLYGSAYGHGYAGYPGWGYGSYVPATTCAPKVEVKEAKVECATKVTDTVAETLRRSQQLVESINAQRALGYGGYHGYGGYGHGYGGLYASGYGGYGGLGYSGYGGYGHGYGGYGGWGGAYGHGLYGSAYGYGGLGYSGYGAHNAYVNSVLRRS